MLCYVTNVYLATVLATPSNILHEINSILCNFLWDGRRPTITTKVIENSIKLGGLKMGKIYIYILKSKTMAVTVVCKSYKKSRKWVCVVNDIIHKTKLIDSIRGHLDKRDKFPQCVPKFYRNIFCTL